MYTELRNRIESKTAKITVIGLGYVGLPLAIVLADAGFRVWGIDTNETRAGAVSAGDWPLDTDEPHLPEMLREVVKDGKLSATPDHVACQAADVVIVCVPTPVGEDKCPDYGALWSALCGIGDNMRGGLVILESTLAPMTTEDAVQMLGDGFWIAHCPERVTPKRLLTNLRYMPRIVGGYNLEATLLARSLYLQIVDRTIELCFTDALTAEIVKCAENAYRDVQIAFANELAVACDQLGADVWEVRELVNTCPGREMLRPGPGVGGACLTKDSWLLASSLPEPPSLMLTAREVNDGMAAYIVDTLVASALDEARVPLLGAIVVILGAAYRAGTSDVRESPATRLMLELSKAGAEVMFYDPHVDGYDGDLEQALTHADVAVIATGHMEFVGLDWSALGKVMRNQVLVDARGIVAEAPEGFIFRGLGRG